MEKDNSSLIYALKLLSMRMHTEKELLRKMHAKKRFAPVDIRRTIEYLKLKNFVNDIAFTQSYAEELRNKATGDIRIRFQLKRKGVSENIIENSFTKEDDGEQLARALELAQLKSKTGRGAEAKEKKRIYNYLVRKGFDYEVARSVIGKLAKSKSGVEREWDS